MTTVEQFNQRTDDRTSIDSRRIPTLLAFVVALVFVLSPGATEIGHPALLWAAFVGAALLTAAVYLLRALGHLSESAVVAVPLIDTLLIASLCAGTGESSSVYTFMLVLPVVSLAALRGRRALVTAVLMVPAVAFVASVWASGRNPDAETLTRGVLTLILLALAGLATHEAFRRLRLRNEGMEVLQFKQAELLVRASEQARELVGLNRRLKGARETLGGIVDASTQSIIGTDLNGDIRVFNPGAERSWGYRRADVLRVMSILELHLPEELEHRRTVLGVSTPFQALVTAARKGQADVQDWTYLTSTGARRDVEVAVTARYDERGDLAGFLFAATDMTDRREVDRLKEDFVGLVSHELRTPLTSILGYLELVLDHPADSMNAKQREYLDTIERNTERLMKLVDDLLFSARVESGKFTLVQETVDLGDLARTVLDTARPLADKASVSLETDLQADVVVAGDRQRLMQAIDNVVGNAIKFTPAGGEILVTVCESTNQHNRRTAQVQVQDTGIGIPANEVDQVFTRFFRASTATHSSIPGAGLGLSIVHSIVDAHGGSLKVVSQEGHGSTITFSLPIDQASEPSAGLAND